MAEGRKPSAKARRSSARLHAVQALYQIAQTGIPAAQAVREIVRHRVGADLDGDRFVEPDRDLFEAIVLGAEAGREGFDRVLAGHLSAGWKLERLETLLRAILRAGCFELKAHPDTATAIIISDYVGVADAFFDGKEPAMVNAVLDGAARSLRGAEAGLG